MQSSRRSTYIVMVMVFSLAAAGFGVMAWEDYKFLHTCRTTIGRVVDVQRKQSESSKASGYYYESTFSYEVGGNVYRSRQKLDAPPALGPATVYYDAADPLKSRLDLPRPYADMFIAFACAAGVIIFGRKIFEKKRRPTPPRITVSPAK